MAAEAVRPRRSLASPGRKRMLGRVAIYVIVVLMAAWSLFPFLYMLQISLSRTVDVVKAPPTLTWPPKLEMWSLVVLGQERTFGSREYKKVGGSEIELPARRVPDARIPAPAWTGSHLPAPTRSVRRSAPCRRCHLQT